MFIKSHPYLANFLILTVAIILSVGMGAVFIPPLTIARILVSWLPKISAHSLVPVSFTTIVLNIRVPHTILIALTGAALASSGAAFQGLFRNPLADPYLIGVASGAGLGAVLAMTVHWPEDLLGYFTIPLGAFFGAIGTVFIVFQLARVGNFVPLTTLILAGVAVGSFASALTSFLMLRSEDQIYRAIAFLLGGSPMAGWSPVLAAFPYVIIGSGLLVLTGNMLNLLQFGEEQAQQLGLSVQSAKLMITLTASLTTAVAVSFSGVIGFIGLIVPHLVRIVWGPDYRRLIPLSILGGATALLVADMLARFLMAPQSLPVGILTALAGTPFFIFILRKAKNEVFW